MEKENILTMTKRVTMKVAGRTIKWMETVICNFKIVFMMGLSNKIIKMVSELNSFQMEISFMVNTVSISSMDKESMYGQMVHLTSDPLKMVIDISMEDGFLLETPPISILETILKIKKMGLEDMFGRMVVSTKVNSTMM